MENPKSSNEESQKLIFSEQVIKHLNETTLLTNFISLFSSGLIFLSFAFSIFLVNKYWTIKDIAFKSYLQNLPKSELITQILFLACIGLYVIACASLWIYSKEMKTGLKLKNSKSLETTFLELFKFFKYSCTAGLGVIFIFVLQYLIEILNS